ncbi:MAG TPA: mobilization protein, partial [Burkholderiaceae bacterium]|nr:mobilization protein [Burkholderiaceae bacterium]
MASLNFIGGEKGGVGKSVVSRLLAQYFIDKDKAFIGFDTDRSHTSFTRFYADYASPVLIDSYEGLDQLVSVFETAPEGELPRVVVDL